MTMISNLGKDAVCEACGVTGPVGPCCRERHVRVCDTCWVEKDTAKVADETGRCPWSSGRPDLAGAIREELDGRMAEDQLEEIVEPLSAAVDKFFEPQMAQLRLETNAMRTELNRAEQVVRAAVSLVSDTQIDTHAAVGELASLLVATYPELMS